MSSFSLFLEPLCGLTILCSVIYGGTVTYGLLITIHPNSQLSRGSSRHLHLLCLKQVPQPAACVRPYRHSARRVSKSNTKRCILNNVMPVYGCVPGTCLENPVKSSHSILVCAWASVACVSPDHTHSGLPWWGFMSSGYLTVTVTACGWFWSNEMLLGFLLIFNGDSYFLKHLR